MRGRLMLVVVAMVAVFGMWSAQVSAQEKGLRSLQVVVVTGGHDYDKKAFPDLFKGHEGVQFAYFEQKTGELFEDISAWKYDVIVLYNMNKQISPKQQENFLKLLNKGVGVVALHHCIAAWPQWTQWSRIIGGRYFEQPGKFAGKDYPGSTYLHDVKVKVKVEAVNHPITAGVKDFELMDETYRGQWVDPDATLLLSTTEKTSDTQLAWAKTSAKARVVYIQLGHGPQAFQDANYKKLLNNAIRWTAPATAVAGN